MIRDAQGGVRRLTFRTFVTIAGVGLAIGLAACGGSSKKTASGTSPAVTAFTATSPPAAAVAPTVPTTTATTKSKSNSGGSPPSPPAAPGGHGHHPKPPPLGPILAAATVRQRANAACAATHSKESALARPGDFDTNAKAATTYLNKLTKIELAETQALHLNVPDSLRAQWIRFFGNVLRHQLYTIIAGNMAATGRGGWAKQLQVADRFWASTIAPAARQLGLTACETA